MQAENEGRSAGVDAERLRWVVGLYLKPEGIKELCEALGVTQQDLAHMVRLTPQGVSLITTGQSDPRLSNITALGDILLENLRVLGWTIEVHIVPPGER